MSRTEGRTFEVQGDWFAEWPTIVGDPALSVELAPSTLKASKHGRRTHRIVGRIRSDTGQLFVLTCTLEAPHGGRGCRYFVSLSSAPFERGISTEGCMHLMERVGALFVAAGARPISAEEARTIDWWPK